MSVSQAHIFTHANNIKLQGYATSVAIFESSPEIKQINIQNYITQRYNEYGIQNGNILPKLMHNVLNTCEEKLEYR